jgi:hypothetical protein
MSACVFFLVDSPATLHDTTSCFGACPKRLNPRSLHPVLLSPRTHIHTPHKPHHHITTTRLHYADHSRVCAARIPGLRRPGPIMGSSMSHTYRFLCLVCTMGGFLPPRRLHLCNVHYTTPFSFLPPPRSSLHGSAQMQFQPLPLGPLIMVRSISKGLDLTRGERLFSRAAAARTPCLCLYTDTGRGVPISFLSLSLFSAPLAHFSVSIFDRRPGFWRREPEYGICRL